MDTSLSSGNTILDLVTLSAAVTTFIVSFIFAASGGSFYHSLINSDVSRRVGRDRDMALLERVVIWLVFGDILILVVQVLFRIQ